MSAVRATLVLGLLAAFGPLSMDLYLPQLPSLASGFVISDALAQTTMSACMIGLGAGQLLAGPLSDRFGRRLPLLLGVAAFAVLSGACAMAPTIEVLLAARMLQGIAGSAGIVISLAVARDLFSGVELSRMLSLLLVVTGSAPVVAPLIGGQLALVMGWRGIFWVLSVIGVALCGVVLWGVPETLDTDRRHTGGFRILRRHVSTALGDRLFVAVLVASAAGGTAFFSYLSMSSFVLQKGFGLTPQLFSFAFAANAVASIAGAQLSRLVVAQLGPRAIYLTAVTAACAAALVLLALCVAGGGLVAVLVALVAFMFFSGSINPNSQALALGHHGVRAGTAAALLGTASLSLGPVVAPLAVLGGATAPTMATTMAVASVVAALVAWLFVRSTADGRCSVQQAVARGADRGDDLGVVGSDRPGHVPH